MANIRIKTKEFIPSTIATPTIIEVPSLRQATQEQQIIHEYVVEEPRKASREAKRYKKKEK